MSVWACESESGVWSVDGMWSVLLGGRSIRKGTVNIAKPKSAFCLHFRHHGYCLGSRQHQQGDCPCVRIGSRVE